MAISDLTGPVANFGQAMGAKAALGQQQRAQVLGGVGKITDTIAEARDRKVVEDALRAAGLDPAIAKDPHAAVTALIQAAAAKTARSQQVEDRDISNRGQGLSPTGEYLGPDQDPRVQSANAVGESALDRAMREKTDERDYAEGQDAIIGAESLDLTRPGVGFTGKMHPMVPLSGLQEAPATPSLVDKRAHAPGAPPYRTASIDRAMKYSGALQPPKVKPPTDLQSAQAEEARANAERLRAEAGRGPTSRNEDPNSPEVLARRAKFDRERVEFEARTKAQYASPKIPTGLRDALDQAKTDYENAALLAGFNESDPRVIQAAAKRQAAARAIDDFLAGSRPKIGKSREPENAQEDAAEGGQEEAGQAPATDPAKKAELDAIEKSDPARYQRILSQLTPEQRAALGR